MLKNIFSTITLSVLLISKPVHAGPFLLSTDSVIAGNKDTVTMLNTTNNTLTIDTITVLFDTTQMPEYQIVFFSYSQAVVRRSFYLPGYRGNVPPNRFTLASNESIKFTDFQFDLCIYCPVMQTVATLVPVGDTIRAGLVFSVGAFKDTIHVKSIRRIFSTGAIPRSENKVSIHPIASGKRFNLAGRLIDSKRT